MSTLEAIKVDPEVQGLAPALGRIASGVFVLTARRDRMESGMLASWVQQCSFEPPQISIAVNRGRGFGAWLEEKSQFLVNVLPDGETSLVARFGRGCPPSETAFDGLEIERTATGVAFLKKALSYLACQVKSRLPVGDHDLVIAQIMGGRLLRDCQPMIHARKNGLRY